MKKISKKELKIVEHLMKSEALHSVDKFPPTCLGILHQPKRPVAQKKN